MAGIAITLFCPRGVYLSWEGLRRQLEGQDRVTVVIHRDDGKVYHIGKATPLSHGLSHTKSWKSNYDLYCGNPASIVASADCG